MIDLLRLQGIRHSFGGLRVLSDVNLRVESAGITGLIGPNGSGKTTLFNIISGYLVPNGGDVRYEGAVINDETVQARCRRGLVRTFQTPRLFEQMTVLENVMVGVTKLTSSNLLQDVLGLSGGKREIERCRAEAEHICHRFDMVKLLDQRAGKLPAGQRRMVEIARAVAGRPKLLLLDEPSSGLNDNEIESLRSWITSLQNDGLSILLVSHDMELMSVVQEVHVLYFGEIIVSGTMAMIQQHPKVREVYLGV